MRCQFYIQETLPRYHNRLLIVKVTRPTGAPSETPGVTMLSRMERAGMIKQVIPLSRGTAEKPQRAPGLATILSAALAFEKRPEDPNAGVSVVELGEGADALQLQTALATDPHFEAVARVPTRYLLAPARKRKTSQQNEPGAQYPMWNLRKIQWEEARAISGFTDALQIRVAVLDTGIEADHPDLAGTVAGYVYEHPDFPNVSGKDDIVGHGTHVSGTITAKINNEIGINGICSCSLKVWKIFTDETTYDGLSSMVYYVDPVMYRRALADCEQEAMHVINLSIGGPEPPDFQERDLFDRLLTRGTTVVAAMGNEREFGSPISYPAAIEGVIAVGATSIDDTVAGFSNRGSHISLCAPGVGIWSTLPTYPGQVAFEAIEGPDGEPIEGKPVKRQINYDSWAGTSMATPHVTAAAALLIANKGEASPEDIRSQLMDTADKVSGMEGDDFHPDYGAGRLNLLKLLG